MLLLPQQPSEERLTPFVPFRQSAEVVESMSWPAGADDSTFHAGDDPMTPLGARVVATRAARELARHYRFWYDTILFTDACAVESMQRHLVVRFDDTPPWQDPLDVWELRRHGALLSEIIARSVGGRWVDVSSPEPGEWTMFVPRVGLTHPVLHIYRLVARGHRERDLLAYYLSLLARTH